MISECFLAISSPTSLWIYTKRKIQIKHEKEKGLSLVEGNSRKFTDK